MQIKYIYILKKKKIPVLNKVSFPDLPVSLSIFLDF